MSNGRISQEWMHWRLVLIKLKTFEFSGIVYVIIVLGVIT